jgi:vacuolar-type H+-ATPase subunit H
MINNIISQIKKAEKKAEKVIASSKKKSKEIIEESYRRSTEILKGADKEVKTMSVKAEDEAKSDAEGKAAELGKEYKNRLEQLKSISETNREKAIKKIVQRIIS